MSGSTSINLLLELEVPMSIIMIVNAVRNCLLLILSKVSCLCLTNYFATGPLYLLFDNSAQK